jgi:hypothetical protein
VPVGKVKTLITIVLTFKQASKIWNIGLLDQRITIIATTKSGFIVRRTLL